MYYMYMCVYMACLHDVVCLSSPFCYVDLNTDDIFQSNTYMYIYTCTPPAKTLLYRSSILLVNKYGIYEKNEREYWTCIGIKVSIKTSLEARKKTDSFLSANFECFSFSKYTLPKGETISISNIYMYLIG